MKPDKLQRDKRRSQDLFCAHTYTPRFYWLVPWALIMTYRVLCTVKAKRGNKNIEQRGFFKFHNHLPVLTMFKAKSRNQIILLDRNAIYAKSDPS